MKDENRSTDPKPDATPQSPGEASPPSDADRAAPGSEQHRENQDALGVGPDHRTEDMKRGHRGTFP